MKYQNSELTIMEFIQCNDEEMSQEDMAAYINNYADEDDKIAFANMLVTMHNNPLLFPTEGKSLINLDI